MPAVTSELSPYHFQLELWKARVEKYSAALRKPGDDYSRVLPHVPPEALAAARSAFLEPQMRLAETRIRIAEARVKMELRAELLCHLGHTPTDQQLDAALDAIPREDYYRLVAART